MAKYDKISPETQQEAMKIARANQKPGQTKEQTQLIAQGIQKGDVYKRQLLHHGDSDQLREVSKLAAARQAARNGAIIGVHGLHRGETDIPLERLLIEHALSVNTAAAGGNASLMTIG